MKQITDFVDWLFDYRTPAVFPALILVGSIITILLVAVGLLVTAPLLGVLFVAGIFFGIPYVGYRVAKAKAGEQDE